MELEYCLLVFPLTFPLEEGMIAIKIHVMDFLLVFPLAVSMVAIEIRVVDFSLALLLAVGILGAEVYMMPFLLALPLELSMVLLVEFLARTCIITEPDIAIVTLFVEEVGEFL